MKMSKDKQIADHIVKVETKFATLAAMNGSVSESMHVAILVSFLSNLPMFALIRDSSENLFSACVNFSLTCLRIGF